MMDLFSGDYIIQINEEKFLNYFLKKKQKKKIKESKRKRKFLIASYNDKDELISFFKIIASNEDLYKNVCQISEEKKYDISKVFENIQKLQLKIKDIKIKNKNLKRKMAIVLHPKNIVI